MDESIASTSCDDVKMEEDPFEFVAVKSEFIPPDEECLSDEVKEDQDDGDTEWYTIDIGETIKAEPDAIRNWAEPISSISGDEQLTDEVNEEPSDVEFSNGIAIEIKEEPPSSEGKAEKFKQKQPQRKKAATKRKTTISIKTKRKTTDKNTTKTIPTEKTTQKSAVERNGRIYDCHLCKRRCISQASLDKHIETHADERPFRCSICTKPFKRKDRLVRHLETHSIEKQFSCAHCSMKFAHNSELQTHMKSHTELSFSCPTCRMFFAQQNELEKHQMASQCNGFECYLCGQNLFHRVDNLKRHIRGKHTCQKRHKCDQCGKRFALPSLVKKHMKSHSDEKTFSCKLCPLKFKCWNGLQAHSRMHPVQYPFKCGKHCERRFANEDLKIVHELKCRKTEHTCGICGKSFRTTRDLYQHSRVHSAERSFRCEICSKTFKLREGLTRHLKTHQREKRTMTKCTDFECYLCGKKPFPHMHALTRHMLTHTGSKPYRCDQCSKRFAQLSNLKRHLKTHNNRKPFKCEFCPMKFKWKEVLRQHSKMHPDQLPFKCSKNCERRFADEQEKNVHENRCTKVEQICGICGMTLKTKSNLQQHLRVHSDEKEFKCHLCTKAYKKNTDLRKHIKKNH